MLLETETSDGETDVKCIDGFIPGDDVLDCIVRPFSLVLTSYCVVPVSSHLASYPSSYSATITSGYHYHRVGLFSAHSLSSAYFLLVPDLSLHFISGAHTPIKRNMGGADYQSCSFSAWHVHLSTVCMHRKS